MAGIEFTSSKTFLYDIVLDSKKHFQYRDAVLRLLGVTRTPAWSRLQPFSLEMQYRRAWHSGDPEFTSESSGTGMNYNGQSYAHSDETCFTETVSLDAAVASYDTSENKGHRYPSFNPTYSNETTPQLKTEYVFGQTIDEKTQSLPDQISGEGTPLQTHEYQAEYKTEYKRTNETNRLPCIVPDVTDCTTNSPHKQEFSAKAPSLIIPEIARKTLEKPAVHPDSLVLPEITLDQADLTAISGSEKKGSGFTIAIPKKPAPAQPRVKQNIQDNAEKTNDKNPDRVLTPMPFITHESSYASGINELTGFERKSHLSGTEIMLEKVTDVSTKDIIDTSVAIKNKKSDYPTDLPMEPESDLDQADLIKLPGSGKKGPGDTIAIPKKPALVHPRVKQNIQDNAEKTNDKNPDRVHAPTPFISHESASTLRNNELIDPESKRKLSGITISKRSGTLSSQMHTTCAANVINTQKKPAFSLDSPLVTENTVGKTSPVVHDHTKNNSQCDVNQDLTRQSEAGNRSSVYSISDKNEHDKQLQMHHNDKSKLSYQTTSTKKGLSHSIDTGVSSDRNSIENNSKQKEAKATKDSHSGSYSDSIPDYNETPQTKYPAVRAVAVTQPSQLYQYRFTEFRERNYLSNIHHRILR